jgi:hypothetical protein
MGTFAYLYDEVADTKTDTTSDINKILIPLQLQGAEIEDIKISSVERTIGVFRSILIIYEADEDIKL